jgi:hypothetical protein
MRLVTLDWFFYRQWNFYAVGAAYIKKIALSKDQINSHKSFHGVFFIVEFDLNSKVTAFDSVCNVCVCIRCYITY